MAKACMQSGLADDALQRDAYHAVVSMISQVYGAKGIAKWLIAKISDAYSADKDAKYADRNLAFYDFINNDPEFERIRQSKDFKNWFPKKFEDCNFDTMEAKLLVRFPRNLFPVFQTVDSKHVLWDSKKKDPTTNVEVEEDLHELISKLNEHRIPADISAIRIIGWLRNSYAHEANSYDVHKMKFHLYHAQSAILYLLALYPDECEQMGKVCDILKSEKVMKDLDKDKFFQTMNKSVPELIDMVQKMLKISQSTIHDHSIHDHSRTHVENIYNISMSDGVVVNFPDGFMRADSFKMKSIGQEESNGAKHSFEN